MIKLENIYKEYLLGSIKVKALDNINLKFKTKEFVFIHGPSGCGKTTLLNIIGGLDKATKGNLIIHGLDTKGFKDNDWDSYRNQEVGFIFQNYYLLPQLNVFENIEIALELINIDKFKRIEMVNKALESVGLLNQAKKMPNQLSGGQIQRVAIARAIVNEPSIILADEPTGALDTANADMIMKILKKISKDRLVILVSHNLELAKTYADRIVEMVDGEVKLDSGIKSKDNELKEYKNKKTSMSLITSFKISIRNLLRTRLRTPLIIFAGCIGMIGIGLVLSIARGVDIYIEEVQKSALASYPIRISSSPKELNIDGEKKEPLELYPLDDKVHVRRGEYIRDYYNTIDKNYINYLEKLDSSLYSVIDYNRSIKMNLISKNLDTNTYYSLSANFREMTSNLDFMKLNYEALVGDFPTQPNELALVIGPDNSIQASFLNYLQIDSSRDTISFADIIGKEYKLIENNNLYYKDINGVFKRNYNTASLYASSDFTIKITAILRAKPESYERIYSNVILYSKELTDYILTSSLQSDIVLEQLEYGLEKDVFTNEPYEDKVSDYYTTSKMYLYESTLIDLGAVYTTTSILIYTQKFHDRLIISDYLKRYNDPDATVEIYPSDNMEKATSELSELVRVFSTVLIIFSSVSLVVSSIMIGIITYVSVLQRTKEIGLLRSIGARKKDIARLFNVETLIIGLASGVFGVIGVFILLNPVNNYVQEIGAKYAFNFRGVESVIIARFEIMYMLILVIGSMVISVMSGFIPAIMASRKSPIDALRNER